MAIATLYDYTGAAYSEIEESYLNVGASNFSLGTIKRAFKDSTLEIWTGAGKTGTELIVDTDFTIETNDAFYGSAVFTELNVSNVTYQTGTIYISYQPYGSYDEKATVVGLRTDVDINTVHSTGDGSGHSDVATNTIHSTGDGSDHADVATNTVHSTGDGSDHADVATNTSDITDLETANSTGRLVVFEAAFPLTTPENTFFDLIQSYVPTTGEFYQCDGWFGIQWLWMLKRESATVIKMYMGASDTTKTVTDGDATQIGFAGHIVI